MNPVLTLSPELNAALAGRRNPAFGNPQGFSGSQAKLSTIRPSSGNFAKITPAAFKSLSGSGQAQYASLAQARTGQRPEDLQRAINAQLPSSRGRLPAAFR
ncbi:MAG: hypothetical protein CL878_07310 [Dehalococcoidia bacterium]|nr:hypothetical protein [Dehalococcoidia bacterium]